MRRSTPGYPNPERCGPPLFRAITRLRLFRKCHFCASSISYKVNVSSDFLRPRITRPAFAVASVSVHGAFMAAKRGPCRKRARAWVRSGPRFLLDRRTCGTCCIHRRQRTIGVPRPGRPSLDPIYRSRSEIADRLRSYAHQCRSSESGHLGARDAFDNVAHQFVVGGPMLPLPGRQVRSATPLSRIAMTCGAFFDKNAGTSSYVVVLGTKRSDRAKNAEGESSDAHF
jgi:hypothetical protein